MSKFDGDDLDEPGEAVETLPFEQRKIIFISDLLDDSFDKSLDIEASALLGLEDNDVFWKTAEDQQTHLYFMPSLPWDFQLSSDIYSTEFG